MCLHCKDKLGPQRACYKFKPTIIHARAAQINHLKRVRGETAPKLRPTWLTGVVARLFSTALRARAFLCHKCIDGVTRAAITDKRARAIVSIKITTTRRSVNKEMRSAKIFLRYAAFGFLSNYFSLRQGNCA
jgi:hypothetical protein